MNSRRGGIRGGYKGSKNNVKRCLSKESSTLSVKQLESQPEKHVDNPEEPILVEGSSEGSAHDSKELTFTEENIKKYTLKKTLVEKNRNIFQNAEEINAKGARVKKVATWLSNMNFEEMVTPGESVDTKMATEPNTYFISGDTFCSCCFTRDARLLKFKLGDKCFENVSAKDAILKILPYIDFPLMDTDAICNRCFEVLMKTLRFIKTFMDVNSCRLTRSESQNRAVEGITVDSNSIQNAVEDDVDENQSVSKEDVVEPTHRKNNDDSFKIEFVVEDEGALSEEERYFDEVSCYCATKTMYKTADHRVFKESEAEPFDKMIVIPNARETLLHHLLFDIYKDIAVFQHSSACQDENKRLLLLGNVHYKFCSSCEKHFATQDEFKQHMTQEKCRSNEQNSIEYFFKTPSLTSLKCDVCGASFGRLNHKRAHMTKCVMFECFYCKAKLNGNQLFEHSRTLHNDSRPFKCGKCTSAFRSYKKYKEHNCDKIMCEKCGRIPASLQTHQCGSPTRSKSVTRKCCHCDEYIVMSEYKQHIRLKHRVCYCECKRSFFTMEELEAHKNSSCPAMKQLCNICGRLFAKGHMRQHLKIHEQRVRSFECETCNRKYFTSARLRDHMKKSHFGKEVMCEYCGITLREYSMKGHILLKHNQSIHKLKCPMPNCGKLFLRRDYLNRHITRHQRGLRQFSLRRTPFGDRMVTCKFCLKEFKGLPRLKVHLVNHLRLSRYKCRFCTMTYTSYNNRLRHEKKFHKKAEEGFRCNTCWKREPTKEKLNVHIETVHKKKKYKCENCGEAFSRHFQLNTHLIVEHVKPFEIEEERNYIFHEALSEYIKFEENGTQIESPLTPHNHIEYEVESNKSAGEEYTDEDIIDESMYRLIKVEEHYTVPNNSEQVNRFQVKNEDEESN